MSDIQKFIEKIILKDRQIIINDSNLTPTDTKSSNNETKLIADFTEYSPLHNGHLQCFSESKKKYPNSIFVAIVPGPTERNGRGMPYLMTRQARSQAAINNGVDIVIEGPPMGIMGSGQYSLCLAGMFKALNVDIIPRGYKPVENFDIIMERIKLGHPVIPKPYKIVDLTTNEILSKKPLTEDNYVIVSLSKSLNKVNFDFQNKFFFVKRIENISGTFIRENILNNNWDLVNNMVPYKTIEVLRKEIKSNNAPLNNHRCDDRILNIVNESSKTDLLNISLLDENTVNNFITNRPFSSVEEIIKSINQGFSIHYKNRILSALEANINKETISKYINNYPSIIRILNYKNKHVLQKFEDIISRSLEIWQ